MMQVKIYGLERTFATLKKINHNIKTEPTKLTKKLAHVFKKDVINLLNVQRQRQSAGHSTPVPLQRHLHLQKQADGHRVYFDESGQALAKMVEGGTKPHMIPNAFGSGRTVPHPGARPKRFWSNSIWNLERKIPQETKALMKRIVKG